MLKPFKPLTIKKPTANGSDPKSCEDGPPAKRQRLSNENVSDIPKTKTPQLVFKVPGISSIPRRPLNHVENSNLSGAAVETSDEGLRANYYNVLWRKFTNKKHKNWDGDGILRVSAGFAYLIDVSGKELGKTTCTKPLLPESTLSIGGKEVEVESVLSREDYLAGRPFLNPIAVKALPTAIPGFVKPKFQPKALVAQEKHDAKKKLNVAAPVTIAAQSKWKNPMLANTVMEKKDGPEPTPRHDPKAANALVMKRPKTIPKGKQVVDVVVDPILTKHLREHQRKGVEFLYECVMGLRDFNGEGAILADEMGLGKTLQTIALLWTLLKQNPIYEEGSIIKKALIVCPVTLINNWKKEFRKWLGNERIGVFVMDDAKHKRISDFTRGRSYHVMIIGYEKLRTVQEDLKKGPGIDIVIADEGHRLKTAKNKSAEAIKSLNTERRIILSGTPIQNDLTEFFTMVDFVNPGILGDFKSFTKNFEVPIIKSRQPTATPNEIEKGEARSEELAETTAPFILRRTADILSKYLPSKTEYIILCKPTSTQAQVYRHILGLPAFNSALGGASETYLQLITLLKKVCNCPRLLSPDANPDLDKTITSPLTDDIVSTIPPHLLRHNASSAKIRMLDELLHTIRSQTNEKVVLVSNFTSTLTLLSGLLASNGWPFLRLDGSTPSSKRQDLVDTFNRTPAETNFAFLLSAKAGGMGLNLIGASRLILFDVDWNPAVDAQAMARIHRDGQKRPCVIYRLLLAGGLDEKIWQRQITKVGLASSVMDGNGKGGGSSSFSREELKDLFRLDEASVCQTHDLIGCECGGRGVVRPVDMAGIDTPRVVDSEEEDDEDDLPEVGTLIKASLVSIADQERRIVEKARAARKGKDEKNLQELMKYTHVDPKLLAATEADEIEVIIQDEVLRKVLEDEQIEGRNVGFVFARTSV